MRKYIIELDEAIAEFFEEVARIVRRPTEDVISDALLKQVEMISRKASESTVIDDENLS